MGKLIDFFYHWSREFLKSFYRPILSASAPEINAPIMPPNGKNPFVNDHKDVKSSSVIFFPLSKNLSP